MVVEVAEVEGTALVEGIQVVELGRGGFGDFGHGGASLGGLMFKFGFIALR
jgi:hypothetical protein